MWPKITPNYSPNFSIKKRTKKKVRFIIIHYTGMKNELSAVNRLCSEKSKVSAHYFIKRDGIILNLVPDLYEAWHAGKSGWKNITSLNQFSIGIEIQNPGHGKNYKKFTSKQIISLKGLLKSLILKYKVNYRNILGHSDIAPDRKKDPGEKFPWKELAKFKLALWYKLDKKKLTKNRLVGLNLIEQNIFLKNLNKIGYQKFKIKNSPNKNKYLIKAFQRRFRQSLVNGVSDKECLMISKNLIKS